MMMTTMVEENENGKVQQVRYYDIPKESLTKINELVQSLDDRLTKVEKRLLSNNKSESTSTSIRSMTTIKNNGDGNKKPLQAKDTFALYMLTIAVSHGFRNTRFVRCPSNYYDEPLEWRRRFLNAPHTLHMMKSIVVQNVRQPNEYVCCVIPYAHKLDMMGSYRLADDCFEVTGYAPNGVTPLKLKTAMKVMLDQSVTRLKPSEFWLGGGEVSLKWNVQLCDFIHAFQPVIQRISSPN